MKRTISKSERPYRLLLCVMISLLVIMLQAAPLLRTPTQTKEVSRTLLPLKKNT